MLARMWCALLVALLLGACADGRAPERPDTPDVPVEAIRTARERLGGPAGDLLGAARAVEEGLDGLLEEPGDPKARIDRAERLRSETLPDLQAAVGQARTALAGPGDVPEATAAMRAAVGSAGDLLAVVDSVAERQVAVARAERTLNGIRGGWDRSGSYSEQLTRFEELRARAQRTARRLRRLEGDGPCRSSVVRHRRGAERVAAVTGELRELIAARRGEAFDDRRRELARRRSASPRPTAPQRPCRGAATEAADAVTALEDAVGRLEAALNPSPRAT